LRLGYLVQYGPTIVAPTGKKYRPDMIVGEETVIAVRVARPDLDTALERAPVN
jgi:hypothetical protein